MTTDIRLNGCLTKDITHIVNFIQYRKKIDASISVETEMINQANIKARHLIEDYNLRYCKIIIKSHAENNIFNAIKRVRGSIDYSSEINFYRQLVFPYVEDIIYNKIKTEYEYMIPRVLISEPTECSICLCRIDDTFVMTITRCNHYFHRNCLTRWKAVRRYSTCPNCRVAI